MSRIGKQLITLPKKVEYTRTGARVAIKGPLGSVSRDLNPAIVITEAGQTLSLAPERETVEMNALWGTVGAHLRNMIQGVTTGFEKKLVIEGVGYRVAVAGQKLTFSLGFSHPVVLQIPAGLKVVVDKNLLTVSGVDKDLVGQFTAEIRALKPPEPYKGKGIHYDGEVIRRKEGKRVTT